MPARAPAARPPRPAPPHDETTVRVMDALRRLVRELSASARATQRAGISGAQLYVMREIAAHPGLSIGELADRTHARQSTVSEVVARLVGADLVARRPGEADARQVALTLTARGRRAIAGAARTAQERLADALGTLRAAEREALAGGLEAWLDAAGLADAPPTMFMEPDA